MSLFGGGRRDAQPRTEDDRRQAMIDRERRRNGDPTWEPPPGHPLHRAGTAQAAPQQPAQPRPAAQQPPAAAPPQQPAAPQQRPAPREPDPVLRPARPAAGTTPPQPQPQSQPIADGGWWDEGDAFDQHAAGEPVAAWPPPLEPAQPRTRAAAPSAATGAAPAAPRTPAADPGAANGHAPDPGAPRRIDPDPPAQPLAEAFDLPDHRQVAVHRRRSFASRSTSRTVVSPPGDADMGGSLTRGRSRRRKAALLVVFLFLALVAWSQIQLWQPFKGSGGEEIIVEIPQGSGASDVGRRLQAAGVVDSARLFTLRAIIAGDRENLPSGQVELAKDMSYGAALNKLNGATVTPLDLQDVTIPEGLSIREIAARFKRQNTVDDYGQTAVKILRARKDELRADYGVPKNARTLEGLLFPSTYELPAGFTARDLIDRQLQAFEQNVGSVDMSRAKKANLTPYDVLTIASMVEREARLTRERPLIAAVIYNRLKAGMPIGIDATFRYASGNWNDPIRQSELEKDGPYNSRTRTGLPPTPIGNPGLASIEAAANPAKVNYLYFVVKPGRCGEHAFAATAEKFNQDSAKYNAARNAAGGSPDTC